MLLNREVARYYNLKEHYMKRKISLMEKLRSQQEIIIIAMIQKGFIGLSRTLIVTTMSRTHHRVGGYSHVSNP